MHIYVFKPEQERRRAAGFRVWKVKMPDCFRGLCDSSCYCGRGDSWRRDVGYSTYSEPLELFVRVPGFEV